MLIDANLRDFFWPFAVLTAVHIKQCILHSAPPTNVTPFELWFGHWPNLSHLRPFGTACTFHIITNHLTKFEPCSELGQFLGYVKDAKGYLIWVPNPNNNGRTLKVCRDVVFHDFPTHPHSPPVPPHYLPLWENVDFPDCVRESEDTTSPELISPLPMYVHTYSMSPNNTQIKPPFFYSHVSTGTGHPPSDMDDPITIPQYIHTMKQQTDKSHHHQSLSCITYDDGHSIPQSNTHTNIPLYVYNQSNHPLA